MLKIKLDDEIYSFDKKEDFIKFLQEKNYGLFDGCFTGLFKNNNDGTTYRIVFFDKNDGGKFYIFTTEATLIEGVEYFNIYNYDDDINQQVIKKELLVDRIKKLR